MLGFVHGRVDSRFVTLVTALAVMVAGILLPAAACGSGPVVRSSAERSDRPQCEATTEASAEDHEQDDERVLPAALPGSVPGLLPIEAVGSAVCVARCRVLPAGHRGATPIRGPPLTTAIR